MKVYGKNGEVAEASKEQLPALEAAGWSRTAPEEKVEKEPDTEEKTESTTTTPRRRKTIKKSE